MSMEILFWSVISGQFMIGLSMLCAAKRLIYGPRAQDRIVGFDYLYILTMIMLLLLGIRSSTVIYFEAALIIAMLGFVSSIALAKFIMRGEVIE